MDPLQIWVRNMDRKKEIRAKNSENETGTSKRRGSGEEPADHETH